MPIPKLRLEDALELIAEHAEVAYGIVRALRRRLREIRVGQSPSCEARTSVLRSHNCVSPSMIPPFSQEFHVSLKFGFLFSIRNPSQWQKPWPQVYSEMLEQVQAAEELGFDSVWMSEHHGAADGYCPSTLVAAGAAAARTQRITIGIRLLLLPLHHPVRVAEDAAVVDNLSNGRFILGMAVGYVPPEYGMFGVNRRHRPSLMDEGIDIIRRCWTEERFDYEGKRFNLKNVSVVPKPI